MQTTVTKRITFCAGHRLYNPQFDDQKNREVFGTCSNPKGHGHNYVLEVTVCGKVDEQTGMVINLTKMKAIIEREVVTKLDHLNLNEDVDFLLGVIPSAENLAAKIWEILDRVFVGEMLTKITLWESENSRVEVTR